MHPYDQLRERLGQHAAGPVRRPPEGRDAAVGVLLREAGDPEILLIRRAERPGDPWSGHMALPGGLHSADDGDLAATLIRETREETGIQLRPASILGALDPVAPATPRLPPIYIAPFVARVPADTLATPDLREVMETYWIPISYLRDERNAHDYLYEGGGVRRTFPSVRYGDHVIWGLTHRILQQFLEIAGAAGL